jgi:hypothetical protein
LSNKKATNGHMELNYLGIYFLLTFFFFFRKEKNLLPFSDLSVFTGKSSSGTTIGPFVSLNKIG